MWMVRAGRGGENIDEFQSRGIVGFGDGFLGALPADTSKETLLARYAVAFPTEKEGTRAAWASQLFRFLSEVKEGDDVVCADGSRRRLLLGKIVSGYEWLADAPGDAGHTRRVKWRAHVSRDALTVKTRNHLGSVLTVFKISTEAAKEILERAVPIDTALPNAVAPPPKEQAKDEEELDLLSEDTFARAESLIQDQIAALSWQNMQELVAGLLRAMGYRTQVSEAGPDRGVDIFASKDGLGLEEPRIFVEVKHRQQSMGAPDIRAFLGGRRKGDRCLYVSTGGFTKEARYEAERAETSITLVDIARLRQLVIDLYDRLDPPTRALVPLRHLYWPAGSVTPNR